MRNIGIDIGTSTISIIVMNDWEHMPEKTYTLENGIFLPASHPWERTQDVQVILSKANQVLEEIMESYDDISAIGLTGQMHGIVYTDENGLAVSPLFTWQDNRGSAPDFEGRSICSILAEDFGVRIPSGYGVATHLYNVRKGLVPEGAVSCCTIADYIGMALTGGTRPLVHISQAAGMGLYDYEKQDYMREIMVKNGADPSLLPQVTAELEQLGTYRGIPVSVSVGDNQASFLGTVRDGANTVLVNVGTGSQISVLTDSYCEIPGVETRPLTKDLYLMVGAAICGGAAYAALESFFREYASEAGAPDVPQFDIMKQILEKQGDSKEAWKIKTTFSGTRDNPNESGCVSGIRMTNFHPAAMIRGVLNGMAEELYGLYRAMETGAGITKTKLLASGNGVRKNVFLQSILGDYFGMPLEIEQGDEEAAVGAAISASAAAGQTSIEEHLNILHDNEACGRIYASEV